MEIPQKEPTPTSAKKTCVLKRHAHPGMAKYTAELTPHGRNMQLRICNEPVTSRKGKSIDCKCHPMPQQYVDSVSILRHCCDLLFLSQSASLVSILLTNICSKGLLLAAHTRLSCCQFRIPPVAGVLKSVHLLCQPASLILRGTQIYKSPIPQ